MWPDGRRRWYAINPDRTIGALAYTDAAAFDSTLRAWWTATWFTVGSLYSPVYTSATIGSWVSAYGVPMYVPQPGGNSGAIFGIAIGNRRVDGMRTVTSCANGCRSGSSGLRGAVQGAAEVVNSRATSFGLFDIASQDALRAVSDALYDAWMNTRASARSDGLFYASARSYVGLANCALSPARPDCVAAVTNAWGTTAAVVEVASEGVFGDRVVRSYLLDSEARLPADLLNPPAGSAMFNLGNTYSSGGFAPYASARGGMLAGAQRWCMCEDDLRVRPFLSCVSEPLCVPRVHVRAASHSRAGFTSGAYFLNGSGTPFVEAYSVPLMQVGVSAFAVVGGVRGLTAARGAGAWGSCLNGCLDTSLGVRLGLSWAANVVGNRAAYAAAITDAAGINAVLPSLYRAYVANMDKAAPAAGARARPRGLAAGAHTRSACAAGIGFPNGDLLLISSCRGNPYAVQCGVGMGGGIGAQVANPVAEVYLSARLIGYYGDQKRRYYSINSDGTLGTLFWTNSADYAANLRPWYSYTVQANNGAVWSPVYAATTGGAPISSFNIPVSDASGVMMAIAFGERNANGTYYPAYGTCEDRCHEQSYATRVGNRLAELSVAAVNAPYTPAAGGAPLAFVVIGDWGRLGIAAQTTTAGGMATAAAARGAAFVVSVGDNFYPEGVTSISDPGWVNSWSNVYLASYPALSIPWRPSLGNHDRSGNWSAEILYSAVNPLWQMPAAQYTFRQALPGGGGGCASFIVLDTTAAVPPDAGRTHASGADMDALFAYAEAQLAAEAANGCAWIFVVQHHNVYSGGEHGDSPVLVSRLAPLLRKYGAVSLSGHDHDLEYIYKSGVNYFVRGGGGGGSSRDDLLRAADQRRRLDAARYQPHVSRSEVRRVHERRP